MGTPVPPHPLDLILLGRTLAARWKDILDSLGITETRILTDRPWQPAAPWSSETVRNFPKGQPLPLILGSQKLFWEKSECLVLYASTFLHPACQPQLQSEGHPLEPLVLYRSKAQAVELGSWRPLTSASHYYIASMEVLEKERPVNLSPLPALTKEPFFLDRGVKFRGEGVEAFTIIGPGTQVGKGVRLQSTLVYGGVALGDGTEFREKLILGTTVISPGSENQTVISDPKVIRRL